MSQSSVVSKRVTRRKRNRRHRISRTSQGIICCALIGVDPPIVGSIIGLLSFETRFDLRPLRS